MSESRFYLQGLEQEETRVPCLTWGITERRDGEFKMSAVAIRVLAWADSKGKQSFRIQ